MTHSDEQAELWALGALMEYDAAALLAAHPLTPEAFAHPERALAFRAIESLVAQGRPATLDGVVLLLRGTGALALGKAASAAIDARGWGAERFGTVAERLRGLLRKRRYLATLEGQTAALRAESGDVDALRAAMDDSLRDLDAGAVEVERTGCDDLYDVVDDWQHADERPQRITTGVPLLDEKLGGWMPNINILAGEPGAMKSGLATACAAAQLALGMSVGYVGVEEGTKFIQRRLLAQKLGMRLGAVGNTRLHDYQQERLAVAVDSMLEPMRRLYVDSTATNPERLVRVVRRWVVQRGVKVVYIDHLGELDHRQSVRDRHDLAIRNTLLALRPLALKHGVALVLVAHLNREPGGGRPKKHHLKESGYIEAMGRLVLGCWTDARWPERSLIEVMKGNEVETDVTLWLPRLREAALVETVGGGVIDWNEVEHERREQQRGAAGGWRRGAIGGAGAE